MKKNLLSLALIFSAGIYTYAQNTYINDAVTVKVNPNTLFFHGGDVSVKTSNTGGEVQKIINDGNIQIKGTFNNENSKGKNFVNTYTNGTNYGQLIINDESDVSGKISMERNILNLDNSYYTIGLPFQKSTVKDIINDMVGPSDTFEGTCEIDTPCRYRYFQTLLVWDAKNSEYDATQESTPVKAGSNYTIKLNGGKIYDFIRNLSGATKFPLFGTPNNKSIIISNLESGIRNVDNTIFSGLTWGEWKGLTNNYNETYNSYIGNQYNNDTNKLYGKNLHRFSNPFTSNLDLSIINKPSDGTGLKSWISFTINGVTKYPTEVFTNDLRFQISKLPEDFRINWNQQFGASNSSSVVNKRLSAYLQKSNSGTTPYFWVGSADALLIKPFEYFEVDYYALNTTNLNNRIVNASYLIDDNYKTFSQSYTGSDNFQNSNGVYARNNDLNHLINNTSLQNRGLIGPNDFTQIEFYLTQNNTILDEAAYLVNGSFYNTGDVTTNRELDNKLFLFEETTNGTINRNSQTLLNEFKNDYIGKPLGIGFKDLTNGEQYSIKLRLFEYSILNKVQNLNNGTYYLYDRNTNQISEINSNSEILFVADENINNRFELYWNEVPRTLATDDLATVKSTLVYFNNQNQYVRFDDDNTKATVKVFDLTGRIITNHFNVDTNKDLKLNIAKGAAIYIVNITYENGKTVSKKIIQN